MKKILTLLALMVATVAMVAAGYTLTRPAKAAGDVTNYTDQMTGKGGWMFDSDDPIKTTEVACQVTDNGNGTYNILFPKLELETSIGSKMSFNGDVEFKNVTGTEENGYIVYSGTANDMTVSGKSKGDKLYLTLSGKFYYMSDITLVYGTPFDDTPVVDPDPSTPEEGVVGTDNYTPNGEKFTWNTDIDWNTQKLVINLDLSTCKGLTSDENVISVGSQIAEWAAAPHMHFYYFPSTNKLQFNVMAGTGSSIGNQSRYDVSLGEDKQAVIEISKEKGLVINGTQYINNGASATQYADIDSYLAATANFWALTNIDLGSQQGNPSYATYKSVRVEKLAQTPEPVVYTDKASATYGGTTTENADQTVEITETGDGKYTVVCKQLILGNQPIADFTAEGVEGTTDADGYVNYTFNGNATLTNVNATYALFGLTEGSTAPFTMTGKSKDGKLAAMFTTTFLSKEGEVLFGDYKAPVKPTAYTDKLVLTGSYPGTVESATLNVYDNGDGTYKLEFPKLNVDGLGYLGTVVCPAVNGTVDAEDGSITFEGTNVEFDVEGTESSTTNVSGMCKDGKMYLVLNCKLYGEDNVFTFGTPFAKPAVQYTDKFVYTIQGYATTIDEFTASVTDNGDGTYKIELPNFGSYSATFAAVPGTVQEDGSVVYAADNVEGSISDGMTYKMNVSGKSDGTKLYLLCSGQINEFGGTNSFEFGTPFKEVVPGTVVGEDGYEANNAAFSWTTPIDWDTQKLVASIDLSGCKNSFENILSIGEDISGWGGTNHLHLYYTASTKTLQPNFMAPDNVSRYDLVLNSDELVIELSKRYGLVINGEPWLYKYNSGGTSTTYDDLDAFIEATKTFWALTSLEIGSTQGDTRSNAKYNYIRIQDLPAEEPKIVSTETFTDRLVTTDADQTQHEMTDKQLDINTYSDDTYGVTFHGVETATDELGDITVKGITVTETEEGTVYNGEGLTATINDPNSSLNGKEVKVTVTGQKDKNGKVLFSFEITRDDDADYIVVGEYGTEVREPEGIKYNGAWNITNPANNYEGSVWANDNGNGTYTFYVENFLIDGNNVGGFFINDVPATTAADGTVTLGANYGVYPVEYNGTKPENAVTNFEFMVGTIKGGKLHLETSYVNYGDADKHLLFPVFDGANGSVGISGINADAQNGKAEVFTLGGAKVNSLQKGVNIVRTNGKTVKVVKK